MNATADEKKSFLFDEAVAHPLTRMGASIAGAADLTTSERAVILGILDRAAKRLGLPELPDLNDKTGLGAFPDLRKCFRGAEFPGDDGNDDRIYLRMDPFDVKLRRNGEALEVDIFARDGDLDPLASAAALNEDALENTSGART